MTSAIRLVVSDVDGTIMDGNKELSPSTISAVRRLKEAGVPLALVSSRPPRGVAFLYQELGLSGPLAGFNGGRIQVGLEEQILASHLIPEGAVHEAVGLLERSGVNVWLFAEDQWILKDPDGDYVAAERRTVRFAPTVVRDFTPYLARCYKVVGVSVEGAVLACCEEKLSLLLEGRASAHRSQHYYLDVTHPDANKGRALRVIAEWYGIKPSEVLAIGDMTNDISMFHAAGFSVAMGNAPAAVAVEAKARTATNLEGGWAEAMFSHVLSDAGR